jgi:hypothetical protein
MTCVSEVFPFACFSARHPPAIGRSVDAKSGYAICRQGNVVGRAHRADRCDRGRTVKASSDKSEAHNSGKNQEDRHDVIQEPWRDEDQNASRQRNYWLEMSNSESHTHI